MNDFTVKQYGLDVYGRPVYQTVFYHGWEQARWANLGFSCPIAQGGFMSRVAGGGAKASGGAHDEAKCTDYIIDHLTPAQSEAMVHEFRLHGGALYRRGPDAKHGGMPKHAHNTLGADAPGSAMADLLWASYQAGGDALAGADGRPSNAPDYEWRPSPLVLTPPEEDMALSDEDVTKIAGAVADAVWAKLIPTADAPKGRHAGNIIAKLYNKVLPKAGR